MKNQNLRILRVLDSDDILDIFSFFIQVMNNCYMRSYRVVLKFLHDNIFNPHALPINSCANNVRPEYGFSTPTENERSHMPYLHRDIEKKPLRRKHSCCLGNKLYKNTSRRLLRCFSTEKSLKKRKEKKKIEPSRTRKIHFSFWRTGYDYTRKARKTDRSVIT